MSSEENLDLKIEVYRLNVFSDWFEVGINNVWTRHKPENAGHLMAICVKRLYQEHKICQKDLAQWAATELPRWIMEIMMHRLRGYHITNGFNRHCWEMNKEEIKSIF